MMIQSAPLRAIVREAIGLHTLARADGSDMATRGALRAMIRAIAYTVGGDRGTMELLQEIRRVIATPGTDVERATAEILLIAEQITGAECIRCPLCGSE